MTDAARAEHGQDSAYATWKGWHEFGGISAGQNVRFAGEMGSLNLRAGAGILEIGFGSGKFLKWATDNGFAVLGLETDSTLVMRANAAGFRAFPSIGDVVNSAMPGNLEAVVAFDVVEHLTHIELCELLDDLAGCICPGARLLLQIPNGSSPFVGHIYNGDLTHRQLLTAGSLSQALIGRPYELIAWRRPYPAKERRFLSLVVDACRRLAYATLRSFSRFLYGAAVDWWPVAIAVLEFRPAPAEPTEPGRL